MNSVLILEIKYGGLGDHLFYSHIPRIAKTSGAYSQVLISNRSEFRSKEYQQLVWELNPYVDGFSDASGPQLREFGEVPCDMNLLDMLMLRLGLDDRQRFHEPELFYKPRSRSELSNVVIYDPNYVSFVGDISASQLEGFFRARNILPRQFKVRDKSFELLQHDGSIHTRNVFEYCDVIHSVRQFYCLSSGGATLAASLRKPSVVFYGNGQRQMFHHSKLHMYYNMSA